VDFLGGEQQWQVRKTALRLAMYFGDWSDALDYYIENVIVDLNSKAQILWMKDTTCNIVRQVIDQVSRVYDDPPQRKFKIRNTNNIDDVAEDVYAGLDMLRIGREINKTYNLCNDVVLLVDWNGVKNEPYLRVLNRTDCEVTVNKYFRNIIEKIKIYIDTDVDSPAEEMKPGELSGRYSIVWTNTEHYILLQDNKRIAVPGRSRRDDFRNYYGIIPAVDIHKEPMLRTFWNTITNQELIDLMLHIGMEKSLDRFSYWYNSFKTIFLIGEEDVGNPWPDKINLSPGTVHKIRTVGGSGSVNVADLMNDFEALKTYRENNKKDVFDVFGATIPAQQINEAQSGISLKLKNSQSSELRKEQIPDFISMERRLFPVVRTVWNYWNDNNKINEETTIQTTFGEPEVFISSMEKLKFYWHRYKTGTIDGATFYMTFNPSVDAEEAEVKFEENIQKYQRLFGEATFGDYTGFGDTENVESE
jgi:hypothetical protein